MWRRRYGGLSMPTNQITHIMQILESCDGEKPNIPPTDLFCEGWMLRLVLDWFSTRPDIAHELNISDGECWYSEALIPSQFLQRNKGDPLAESWTHADGVIGHFVIGENGKGGLSLSPSASKLVVIEAKMFSLLSSGVTNAKYFDQAARNVACIAEVLCRAKISYDKMSTIGFHVIAPASRIKDSVFSKQVSPNSIREKVERRVKEYKNSDKDAWFENRFLPVLGVMKISGISWESILCDIADCESKAGKDLTKFYEKYLKYS